MTGNLVLLAGLIAALPLAACQREPTPATKLLPFPQMAECKPGPAISASRAQALVDEAHRAIAAQLRDPESARFGPKPVAVAADCREGTHELVCTTVNAKNAYGGYVGVAPAIFARDGDDYSIAIYPASGIGPGDVALLQHIIDGERACARAEPREHAENASK